MEVETANVRGDVGPHVEGDLRVDGGGDLARGLGAVGGVGGGVVEGDDEVGVVDEEKVGGGVEGEEGGEEDERAHRGRSLRFGELL